jgi:prevent-host-death family protein
MVKSYSIAEARDNFTGVVHEAEKGTTVELTRRGKPVAVLLGVEDFERLAKGGSTFTAAYEKFRREFNLEELQIDPTEVFGDVRDPSPGRDFRW